MFNRSRNKIILSIMGSLILLFAVTLSVILFASYRELQKKSADILNDYIEAYSLEQASEVPAGPGDPGSPGPGPQKMDQPNENRDFQPSTFYSVSFAEDGSILDVDNGMRGIYSDENLIGIAEDIRENGPTFGRRDLLLFRVVQKDGYTLVAFMDNTVTDSSMHILARKLSCFDTQVFELRIGRVIQLAAQHLISFGHKYLLLPDYLCVLAFERDSVLQNLTDTPSLQFGVILLPLDLIKRILCHNLQISSGIGVLRFDLD